MEPRPPGSPVFMSFLGRAVHIASLEIAAHIFATLLASQSFGFSLFLLGLALSENLDLSDPLGNLVPFS